MPFEAAIEFARDLIRIPGLSGDEGAVAERVRVEMERLGFDEVRLDEVGNVIGRIVGGSPGPVVALCSHMDVVDAGDPGTWEHDPYGGAVVDGFLHGRGAMDIKGPLALQLHAAAQLAGSSFGGEVWMVCTVYEERAGWGIAHFLEHADRLPDVVVIGEATAGDLCIGHRGRAEIVVEIQGLAGHASAPERARSAIDGLPAVLAGLASFAETLESDAVLGRSTFVPTGIETAPISPNVIPDLARVTVDWRVLPGVDADAAVERVRRHLEREATLPEGLSLEVRFSTVRQRSYTGREAERRLFTPAYRLAEDDAVVERARASIQASTGTRPVVRPWRFATDGGYACGVHGIPTIGYAPGEERHAHTNRERLSLEHARVVHDAYAPLIRSLLEMPAHQEA